LWCGAGRRHGRFGRGRPSRQDTRQSGDSTMRSPSSGRATPEVRLFVRNFVPRSVRKYRFATWTNCTFPPNAVISISRLRLQVANGSRHQCFPGHGQTLLFAFAVSAQVG
jgi:hypothetical protein